MRYQSEYTHHDDSFPVLIYGQSIQTGQNLLPVAGRAIYVKQAYPASWPLSYSGNLTVSVNIQNRFPQRNPHGLLV